MFHCHDGKADCSDVLYIFSVRMSVYHGPLKVAEILELANIQKEILSWDHGLVKKN